MTQRIAVYGAYGYQGRLVVAELARRRIGARLVGRDADRLGVLAAEFEGCEVRIAAADEPRALEAAFEGAATVINCAGPFSLSGAAVVAAALAVGAAYVDTSGEQLHVKNVFDQFGAAAEAAGITAVPAATDGGAPGDLIAHLLADALGPLEELFIAHLIVGDAAPSRGSLRSVLATIDMVESGGLTYLNGEWRTDVSLGRPTMRFPDRGEPDRLVRFPLQEVVTVPRHVPVRRVEGVAEAELGARLAAPIDADLIAGLPEGPTEHERREQRFTIVADAVAVDGRRARGLVRGSDTYGTTAVIAVEAARLLAVGGTKPGVLAASQAFQPVAFLDALADHGVSWHIEADHP